MKPSQSDGSRIFRLRGLSIRFRPMTKIHSPAISLWLFMPMELFAGPSRFLLKRVYTRVSRSYKWGRLKSCADWPISRVVTVFETVIREFCSGRKIGETT